MDYLIRPGDTLSSIAARMTGNALNWKAIAAANNIADPNVIYAGVSIVIPDNLLSSAQSTVSQPAAVSASAGYGGASGSWTPPANVVPITSAKNTAPSLPSVPGGAIGFPSTSSLPAAQAMGKTIFGMQPKTALIIGAVLIGAVVFMISRNKDNDNG